MLEGIERIGGIVYGGCEEDKKREIVSHQLGALTGDTSILHHAFISIFIALWVVITHYT